MNKKNLYIGTIILVIILLTFFIIGNYNNNSKEFFSFDVPTNYEVKEQTNNYAKLSNNNNEIQIYKLNPNETIETYKEKYPEYKVTQESFTIDNVNKTISENNGETILKYWFVKNNQKFQIQMIKNKENSDKIAEDIINSFVPA